LSLEKGNFFGFGSKKLKTTQKSSKRLKKAQNGSKKLKKFELTNPCLKESGHSAHSILALLGARLGGLKGRVCFQWAIAVFSGTRGWIVEDGLPNHARTLQVYSDGPFRHLQGASRREEVLLAQLRGSHSLLLWETQKRIQGVDSMCPHCGEEEEDHILKACPELESPRRKNFVQIPPPLRVMSTDWAETARFFREVFGWDLP
jgi:hypothetical protein